MRAGTLGILSTVLLVVLMSSACRAHPESPLARAAAEGRCSDLDRLLARGAPVDEEDGSGFTPLVWAARHGRTEAVLLLVRRGADPNRPAGANGWPPLLHAIHKNQDAAALALIEAGARLDGGAGARALRMAAGYGNEVMVRALLDCGVDPRADDPTGAAILTDAVWGAWDVDSSWRGCEAHTGVVRALLEKAPDLSLPENVWGKLALGHARRKGCDEMLALLARPAPAPPAR